MLANERNFSMGTSVCSIFSTYPVNPPGYILPILFRPFLMISYFIIEFQII